VILLDDLPRLRRKVEEIRSRKDQALGAVKQFRERLLKEFGAKTPKEARALLKRLEARERKVAVRYAAAKKKFESEFTDVLED
jgi:hypothetical protein